MNKLFGFGINTFADPSAQLNGCLQDTANVRELATNPNGMLKFDPAQVRLLCDERATRLNIFERLDWCTKGWEGKNDKLIIQASCHGSQVVCRNGDELDDEQDEVLCPYNFPDLWDSPKDAPDVEECTKFLGSAPGPQICDDDIAVFLKKIPESVYTVLIVDACHSGSIARDLRFGPASQKTPRFVPPPMDIENRSYRRQLKSRTFGVKAKSRSLGAPNENVHFIEQNHILLSGCRDDQTSADAYINGQSQGAMTWAFITALGDLGWSIEIGKRPTWLEVHAKMLLLLSQAGYEQVPQLSGRRALLEAPVFGI